MNQILFIYYLHTSTYTLHCHHIYRISMYFLDWSIFVCSSWVKHHNFDVPGNFPAFPGFSQLYRCQAKLPSHLLAGATTSNGYCLIEMYHNRWVFYCTYYTYYISTVYVCTYFKCHMYTILVHISNTCMIFTHTKIHYIFIHV